MTKIIWMSDPHFQNEGTIDGLDPKVCPVTCAKC